MTAERYWSEMTTGLRLHPPIASPLAGDAARLAEILPWFAHNALIHYQPARVGAIFRRRLKCRMTQGPAEMLLALGCFEPMRDILVRLFRAT